MQTKCQVCVLDKLLTQVQVETQFMQKIKIIKTMPKVTYQKGHTNFPQVDEELA